MQRAVFSKLGVKPAIGSVIAAASTSSAQCRAPSLPPEGSHLEHQQDSFTNSPTKGTIVIEEISVDEQGEKGQWSHISTNSQIQGEVHETIRDLCYLANRPRSRSEGDISDTSEITTASADVHFDSAEIDASSSRIVNALQGIVSNMLQDEQVRSMMMEKLENYPEFQSIVCEDGFRHPSSVQQPPMLTLAPCAWPPPRRYSGDAPWSVLGDMIVGLIDSIGQGIVMLGNALRRLPDDVKIIMDGLRHRDGEARRHRLSHGRSKFSEALTRVALLVVLVIFAKRAIRIRIG